MTLGILGGGQLGRMTAFAAARLGLDVRILTDVASGPERAFANVTVADWTEPDVLRRWVAGCDVVTVESEWAPADHLARVLPDATAQHPSVETLLTVRHKGRQRRLLRGASLPQPEHVLCPSREALLAAPETLAYPVVVKRYEGSYDGYGNALCASPAELSDAWGRLAGADGVLAEAFVDFTAELAVQVARGADGTTAVYPVCRSEQHDHRCHAVEVPAGLASETELEAQRVAVRAVETIGMVGIATAELFLLPDGSVLVNELAPRPHNTGHYTIEAAHTSQFENHVRAVCGLPLGDPSLRVPAACMINVLGTQEGVARPDLSAALEAVPEASVHIYGKQRSRPKRKMGHVTVTAASAATARRRAEAAAELIGTCS